MPLALSRRDAIKAVAGATVALVTYPTELLVRAASTRAPRRRMVFAWLMESDPASVASFRKHASVITHISPTWYSMDKNRMISGTPNQDIIQLARAHGVAVVPLIKNKGFSPAVAHDILANSTRRAEAAERVAQLVMTNNYDGINIDFESPFGESRDRFSDFLHRLGALLRPAGKLLTVDVVPQLKPVAQYPNTSWAAPYDYPAIAQAADAVMLMCYAYSTSEPGPISPFWWLQDTTSYALGQIPPQKLVVGMSFYGREWTTRKKKTSSTELTQPQAVTLRHQIGATLHRSAQDREPYFLWHDSNGDHTVYYEDAKSLQPKLEVVRSTGVLGATFWRLGQEASSQWTYIKQALS